MFILLKGVSGEAYNIADSVSVITIRQLAEMLSGIGNCNVVIDAPSVAEKKGYNPVSKSVFSIDKIETLGWEASGSMKEKMIKTIIHRKECALD